MYWWYTRAAKRFHARGDAVEAFRRFSGMKIGQVGPRSWGLETGLVAKWG